MVITAQAKKPVQSIQGITATTTSAVWAMATATRITTGKDVATD